MSGRERTMGARQKQQEQQEQKLVHIQLNPAPFHWHGISSTTSFPQIGNIPYLILIKARIKENIIKAK
jgi:hypothetical protein